MQQNKMHIEEIEELARQHGFRSAGSVSVSRLEEAGMEKMDILPPDTLNILVFLHPYPRTESVRFDDIKDDSIEIDIAKFARLQDYHDVLGRKLENIVAELSRRSGANHSWCGIDSHPLPEKQIAVKAGIGFQGRNTLLISPRYGSFAFLGVVATPLDISSHRPVTAAEKGTEYFCADCRLCQQSCPTSALKDGPALDRDSCISALTQETGRMPWPVLAGMGNNFWGCDICQDVCPYNQKDDSFQSDHISDWTEVDNLSVEEILRFDRNKLPHSFARYAFSWRGARILVRNMLIVLGNNKKPTHENLVKEITRSRSSVLRYHAYYCLYRWYWSRDKERAVNFLRSQLESEEDNLNKTELKEHCRGEEEFSNVRDYHRRRRS